MILRERTGDIMEKTIYIVALEPIDQRYTAQWYSSIPKSIIDELENQDKRAHVVTVAGNDIGETRTSGGFLDFALTNVWKNSQLNKICDWFSRGVIKPGDIFLVTDAWHPGIIQIKYMSELLGIPVEIHSIFHAGSYDKTDILGFTIKDKQWSYNFERSIYHACDYVWFGSEYHRSLFCRVLGVDGNKAFHSGQPHSAILETAKSIPIPEKENIILFGHRISPDKQPEIFEDLANEFPEFKFVFSQKLNLTKDEYYNLIRRAKISFSANLHENFGISMVEAVFNGTVPILPDRLSYSEMYLDMFKYPSKWTESFDEYMNYKRQLVQFIRNVVSNYNIYSLMLMEQQRKLKDEYMLPTKMVKSIVNSIS